jgi:CAAX protease family protein
MEPPLEGNTSPAPKPSLNSEKVEARIASIFAGPQGIRSGWRWVIFLALFFVCAGLLTVVAAAATMALHLKIILDGKHFTAGSVLVLETLQVASLLFAASIMSIIEKRPMGQYGLPLREAFGRRFWQGAAWGFVAITAVMASIWALHGYSFGSLALSGRMLVGYALVWAIGFLMTGFSEEFLFRGYSQFTLTHGMGFWPAAILLSLLFGAGHLTNTGESWTGALSAGLIGLFFCFTLWRTGSIWFAVGLHMAWDFGETFVYAVPDSGIVAPGHLLDSAFHGPRWLTGGSVGPEASVACFIVVGLLFVAFHFAFPHRSVAPDQG